MSEPARSWQRVLGGYEIIAKIGQGGMGAVFKARQISLDRFVALKVVPPKLAVNATFIERFQREARASARLNHPNIVQGIDVGQDAATKLWYFAMEFVDGPSLKKLLTEQKILAEKQVLELALQMARALESAAKNGMVHRDIKPDNILLTPRGEAKLADLGLARHVDDHADTTQAGTAVGTPHYMSPEQARGETDIDPRADIYSLGATMYHLVTGQPPFSGPSSAVVMAKHLTDPAPHAHKTNPQVSESCSRLIHRMMQKNKDQRIQSAHELAIQIERIQRGEAIITGQRTGVRTTTGPRPPVDGDAAVEPGAKKLPLIPIIAAAAVVLIVGGLVASGVFTGARVMTTEVDIPSPESTTESEKATEPEAKSKPATKPKPVPKTKATAKTESAPAPAPAPTPAKTATFEELAAPIEAYEKENPGSYAEVIKRYKVASERVSGLPVYDQILARIFELQAEWDAAGSAEFELRRPKAAAFWKDGKKDQAAALWTSFPKPLRTEAIDALIENFNKEMVEAEKKAVAEAAEAARVQAIEEAKAAAQKQDAFWEKLAEHLRAKEFKEGEALAGTVADASRFKADVRVIKDIFARGSANLGRLVGQELKIGSKTLKISSFENGRLLVKDGAAEIGFNPDKLDPEQFFKVSQLMERDAKAAAYQAALFKFFFTPADAKLALAFAKQKGNDVAPYEERLESQEKKQEIDRIEKAAGLAAVKIDALVLQARFDEAAAALTKFEAEFGETDPGKVWVLKLRDSLADAQVKASMSLGLVGYWKLDEGTGPNVVDASKNGHDGVLTNMELPGAWSNDAAPSGGKNKAALKFDGIDDCVTIPDHPDLSPQIEGPMTLSGWVKLSAYPKSAQSRAPILEKGALGMGWEYALYVYASGAAGISVWTPSGGHLADANGGRVALDEWTHLCGVFDDSTATLYINGKKVRAVAHSGRPVAGKAPLLIGARTSGAQFVPGLIDELRIYKRALTPEEIEALARGIKAVAAPAGK